MKRAWRRLAAGFARLELDPSWRLRRLRKRLRSQSGLAAFHHLRDLEDES